MVVKVATITVTLVAVICMYVLAGGLVQQVQQVKKERVCYARTKWKIRKDSSYVFKQVALEPLQEVVTVMLLSSEKSSSDR